MTSPLSSSHWFASASAYAAVSAAAHPAPLSPLSKPFCPVCLQEYQPNEGPHYPRILTPCAHTFCSACLEGQIKVKGPGRFRCMLHNDPQSLKNIRAVTDVKANFALIDLMEQNKKDELLCQAVQSNSSSSERPKCVIHKTKDQDRWCQKCKILSCEMCAQFGEHKSHSDQIIPVEDMAKEQRAAVAEVSRIAKQVNAAFDEETKQLIEKRIGTDTHTHTTNIMFCFCTASPPDDGGSRDRMLVCLLTLLFIFIVFCCD